MTAGATNGRMDARGMKFVRRTQFRLLHPLLAAVGYDGRCPVKLDERDGLCHVSVPDGEIRTVSPSRWKLYRRGLAARLEALRRQYFVDSLNPPSGAVLDIGANIGEFSLLMAGRGHRVVAIEADPLCVSCLRRNLANRNSVRVLDLLLWNTETDLEFHMAPARADSSVFGDNASISTVFRRASTLDGSLSELDRSSIAFIKCDVEGAEPEVLSGGREILSRTARIAVDTGPERDGADTVSECENILREAGFEVWTHVRSGERTVTCGWRRDGRPVWDDAG